MSMSSGDAADEVVRMMLSGAELTLRMTASATKNLFALSIALAKIHKKLYGRTNMKKMLRDTRDIRVFPMETEQFREFEKRAKKYGLLYASVRDNGPDGKLIDVILPATELDRANSVFEKIKYGQDFSQSEPVKSQEDNEKNVPRSVTGWSATKTRVTSDRPAAEHSGTTNERPSVAVQLEEFRQQLQRVPAKQREAVLQKQMAHKKARESR